MVPVLRSGAELIAKELRDRGRATVNHAPASQPSAKLALNAVAVIKTLVPLTA